MVAGFVVLAPTVGLLLEQGTFLLSALLLWLAACGARGVAGVVALLLTSMHMTLLGALLTLAPRPLYPGHSGSFGLDRLTDQQLGGVLMLAAAGSAYLLGGLYLGGRTTLTDGAGAGKSL